MSYPSIKYAFFAGIINQLGPDNLDNLKKIAEQYSASGKSDGGAAGGDDDDGVPELVDDFEQVFLTFYYSALSRGNSLFFHSGIEAGLNLDRVS
jgi:hypothetical protein